ncbi:hypothetical protein HOO65_070343 [Ceratocystis lukuohia]|uniref:Uncharacterized protein n=1 Tax=Ceratocystis lukuohia TaxID=2019550 RepID=A0ABR4MC82_9PEZI
MICIICYALLLIIFFSPKSFHIDSLTNPDKTSIKPTVAVSLISVVLKAATAALITRCVEHSLWIRLSKDPNREGLDAALTVGEMRRLAQWAVSPLEQFLYVIGGFQGPDKRSLLLRIAGPLLLATAVVGPVLISGISESMDLSVTMESVARTADPWLARMDSGNRRSRGGNSFDNPTESAARNAMMDLNAIPAPVCEGLDDRSTCSVTARVVAIQAVCTSETQSNPGNVGTISMSGNDTTRFCTGENAGQICVELVSASPATYAQFISGIPACSNTDVSDCSAGGIGGQWARIYGVWVNGVDITADSEHRINTVTCDLTYGNITVSQNATSSPSLDRSSFTQASSTELYQYGYTNESVFQLNRIYTEFGNSPYDWTLAAVGTGSNTIYSTPMAYNLLGEDANNDAETVARQIEKNFDMATLQAFARSPSSSDLLFTRSHKSPEYKYDKVVLLILVVPFIATILGTWNRWRVESNVITIGYDPLGIARIGPVEGLAHGSIITGEQREMEDKLKVWRWTRQEMNEDNTVSTRTGIQVGSASEK